MNQPLLLPEQGLRFTFNNYDHIFEVTSVNFGVIRYASIAGGKPFSISSEVFEERYKNSEIQCVFAPDKLLINPEKCSSMRRKERYVQSALLKLYAPTAFEPLKKLIEGVAVELDDKSPPTPRTVARWIHKYRSSCNNLISLSSQTSGNKSLRFPPEIY